jgi:hypothetical protein
LGINSHAKGGDDRDDTEPCSEIFVELHIRPTDNVIDEQKQKWYGRQKGQLWEDGEEDHRYYDD